MDAVVNEPSSYTIYRQVVSQLMSGEEQLPSLPTITLEIRRALAKQQVNMQELSGLIGKDPALSALLMKYASSALLRQQRPPKSMLDVLSMLGLAQVERITMLHSIKSLFTLHSAAHKRLFMETWERLILKASAAAFIARMVGHIPPDHALLASLLSEIGTLAVLSAFRNAQDIPTPELYYKLCREYSKSIGVILLKKWAVDDEYVQVIRNAGDWSYRARLGIELIDVVNLALYHAIKELSDATDLPPIDQLASYHKLQPPLNFIDEQGELALLSSHRDDILAFASTLR